MKNGTKIKAKETEMFVLFLIRTEEQKVYIDVSASKEPQAVLRKHWRGDDISTKDIFSKHNPDAMPVMWKWDAGNMTRNKAKAFVVEWETLFLAEGYVIVGSKISPGFRLHMPTLSRPERVRLREASVSGLLNGDIGQIIKCSEEGGSRCSPCQKYTTEPAEETLQMRVKSDTANRFRDICKDAGLTQGQGLELLMAAYSGNIDPLVQDLQKRLEKANAELTKRDEQIVGLREALRKSEDAKDYPKKVRKAELRGELLKEFFKELSLPKYGMAQRLRIYSSFSGRAEFPGGALYTYPENEGIIHLTLEHVRYSRGPNSCLFIYGRDEAGNRVKIRWFPQREDRFGEPLRDSPFFLECAPWILAVQKEGDAMEMVGSLPNLGRIRIEDEEAELEYMKKCVDQLVKESEELDAIHAEKTCVGEDEEKYDYLNDRTLSLDEKIKMIEEKNRKK